MINTSLDGQKENWLVRRDTFKKEIELKIIEAMKPAIDEALSRWEEQNPYPTGKDIFLGC